MYLIDVEEYTSKANKNTDSRMVELIVSSWSTKRCQQFLSQLKEDQIDEPIIGDITTLNQVRVRRLVCMVVYGWGWEGTNIFWKGNLSEYTNSQ